MKDSFNNILFSYLYRDAGNYKLFGQVIFQNPENISIEEIKSKILAQLIDGEFFDADKWRLPSLKFENYLQELDHTWHEFERVETTSAEKSDNRTIAEFICEIKK